MRAWRCFLLASVFVVFSCASTGDLTSQIRDDSGPPLKEIYAPYFLMGGAINGYSKETAAINHKGMADILKRHFNSTTLSNLMKPSYFLNREASLAAEDGMPVCSFEAAIPSLDFCRDNNIALRGHTLVWHNQTPEWFFYKDFDSEGELADAATMERRLESYIVQVLTFCQTEYPGLVYCWDVANEVINDGGSWRREKSLWYSTMGADYIEKAFFYARKYADSDVRLIYNDYNVFVPAKREAIFKLAKDLKAKGLIDGLGLQPTVGLTWPELNGHSTSSFRQALLRFSELDLELQITELGFHIKGEENRTPANTAQQASRYREMMELLLELDSDNGGPCNITSVTVFGICDDYPLYSNHRQDIYLWDSDCQPKDAFFSWREPGLKRLEVLED